MRVLIKLDNGNRYVTKIEGALSGWINEEKRTSFLTIFGNFPVNGQTRKYTINFKTDAGISLCKKLEKEGTADLSTDFIRSLIETETFSH